MPQFVDSTEPIYVLGESVLVNCLGLILAPPHIMLHAEILYTHTHVAEEKPRICYTCAA